MSREGAICLLKVGETLAPVKSVRGDFDVWFANVLDRSVEDLEVCEPFRGDALPEADRLGGVIITGSPGMVTERADWSEASAAWLADIVERDTTPVLGVCYGHQLIAHGLGGEVTQNPNGREMGTVEVRLDAQAVADDPLLEAGAWPTHMSHVESVVRPPAGAQVLGETDLEAHAALRFGPRQWGVQFHPEFDADIMRRYVEARRVVLTGEGLDPDAMIRAAQETPVITSIVARFAQLAGAG